MQLLGLTAVAMLAFAANSVLTRLGVGTGQIDPIIFAFVRLLSGAAVLAALVGLRGGGLQWPKRPALIAGVAGLLIYLIGFSMAYKNLDAGAGALILFGVVQITMFSGALLAREAVPLRRSLGAGLAFAGLVFLLAPAAKGETGAQMAWFPSALMALAGVGWGIYSLAGRGTADALGATAANFGLAVPVALGMALLWQLPAAALKPTGYGIALALASGAVTSGLGYALWYRLVPQLGAARAAVAQLTVPVIAALAGVLIIGEGMSLRFVLAAALVLGGVVLASRR